MLRNTMGVPYVISISLLIKKMTPLLQTNNMHMQRIELRTQDISFVSVLYEKHKYYLY